MVPWSIPTSARAGGNQISLKGLYPCLSLVTVTCPCDVSQSLPTVFHFQVLLVIDVESKQQTPTSGRFLRDEDLLTRGRWLVIYSVLFGWAPKGRFRMPTSLAALMAEIDQPMSLLLAIYSVAVLADDDACHLFHEDRETHSCS